MERVLGPDGAQSHNLCCEGTVGCGQLLLLSLIGSRAFPPAALCPNPPPTKKITEDDIKVMLYLLEEVGVAFLTQASPLFNSALTGLRAFVYFLLAWGST